MLCVKTEIGPDVTFGSEDDTDNVCGFCWASVVTTGTVEPLSETAQSKHNAKFDINFTLDFKLCNNCWQ